MHHSNYTLGCKLAHLKLGMDMEPFDSPYDAVSHYQRRKEYGMGMGLFGAIVGGGLGAERGKRFGKVPMLVGATLGAGAGYLLGSKGTEAAYDWQHNVLQRAHARAQATTARLNNAEGYPSGVTAPYAIQQ